MFLLSILSFQNGVVRILNVSIFFLLGSGANTLAISSSFGFSIFMILPRDLETTYNNI